MKNPINILASFLLGVIFGCTEKEETLLNYPVEINGIPKELVVRVGQPVKLEYILLARDGLSTFQIIENGSDVKFTQYEGETEVMGEYVILEKLIYYINEEDPGEWEWYLERDTFELVFFAKDRNGDASYQTCKVKVVF